MEHLGMLELTRLDDGSRLLVPGDMVGPVGEIRTGPPERAARGCRLTLRDHTYYDVAQSIAEVGALYAALLAAAEARP